MCYVDFMIFELSVKSHKREEFINITSDIENKVKESGISSGLCHIFIPHTTAGVTINEGADPDVLRDLEYGLDRCVPYEGKYHHMEGNSPAHIKSSIVGCDKTVFIANGHLVLGTWQSIYFCEFDGPRTRKVLIKVK